MKKVLLIGATAILLVVFGGLIYLKIALPDIPVKDVKVEVTEAQLQRGEYLANHVMICMDCHGTRD